MVNLLLVYFEKMILIESVKLKFLFFVQLC